MHIETAGEETGKDRLPRGERETTALPAVPTCFLRWCGGALWRVPLLGGAPSVRRFATAAGADIAPLVMTAIHVSHILINDSYTHSIYGIICGARSFSS